MRYTLLNTSCVVHRERGDPPLSMSGWAKHMPDLSRLLYWLRKMLERDGFRVKRNSTERRGDLTDPAPVLEVLAPDGSEFVLWHGNYMVESIAVEWNHEYEVTLTRQN